MCGPTHEIHIQSGPGRLAQLGERCVRNAEVRGSIPLPSTNFPLNSGENTYSQMPDPESRRVVRRLVIAGLMLWALAVPTYFARVLAFGERPAYIHIRWSPAVDEATRGQEERRYGLGRPEFREGRTWGYALSNVSRANVTALVNDPAVEDTHNINRIKFRPGLFTPRLPYETRTPWIPVGLNVLSVLFVLGGMLAMGLALVELVVPAAVCRAPRGAMQAAVLDPRGMVRHRWQRLIAWAGDRIPPASAEGVALFRIMLGIGILWMVISRPVLGEWAAAPQNVLSSLHQRALQIFVSAPWLGDAIRPWLLFWGALFIAGAMSRLAFAMVTIGTIAWGLLFTTHVTYHTISSFLLALCFLQWSRWGDAWSVDAWRHRHHSKPRGTPQEYGYTVWVPGLILGVVFAAAAIAKLREGGLGWVLNGTVKYHFLSDSRQAMVDWGLHVGQYPWLAVFLSFAAIAIESVVIVGVLSRAYRYRLAAGIAAMSVLGGFVVLQGLRWPGWWLLLLSFLPWHMVRPAGASDPASSRRAAPRQAMAVIALFVLQVIVSAFRLEVTPLLSTYDMYSTTYASAAEYASKAGLSYWVIAEHADGTSEECRISRDAADTVSRAISGSAQWRPAADVIGTCFHASAAILNVSVQGRRSAIDWAKWPPAEVVAVPLAGPVALASRNQPGGP